MRRIAVAGHLCLDITPELGSTASFEPGALIDVGPLALTAGGSVANTGGALTALGAEVVPYATLGDDALADLLITRLSQLGLTTGTLARTVGGTTSYSVVIEPPGQDRTFWHHTGTNATFTGEEIPVVDAAIFHLGYPPLLPATLTAAGTPLRSLLARQRSQGAVTSVDLAVVDPVSAVGALPWRQILADIAPTTDVLSPSLDDLTSALRIDEEYSPQLVERLANELVDAGVAVVAISAGRHGLYVRTGSRDRLARAGEALAALADEWADRFHHEPALPVTQVTTTNGAGDAGTAGLLYGILLGATLPQAARLATAASAAIVAGASPTPATVANFAPELSTLLERPLE